MNKTPIFIVEDDEGWAATLTGKLGKMYATHHFVSGEECIEKLEEIKPKFIVLDYHLEGEMTGLDTLKVIRKKLPQTYVIMFSAQDDVQTAVNIMDNGAYDYVVKGENAFNRLNIITRNIESQEVLRDQLITLNLKVRRERFWLGVVVLGVLVLSFLLYLRICPSARALKWDPYGVAQSEGCYLDPSQVRETLE
jgi:DNA-binding NtrC family response regulator